MEKQRCLHLLAKDDPKGGYFLTWGGVHAYASNYPDQPSADDQIEAVQYLNAVKNALPCSVCRFHYIELLTTSPPRTGSKEELVTWAIEAHNQVNSRTGKPILSVAEAKRKIEQNQNTNWTALAQLREDILVGKFNENDETANGVNTTNAANPPTIIASENKFMWNWLWILLAVILGLVLVTTVLGVRAKDGKKDDHALSGKISNQSTNALTCSSTESHPVPIQS